MPTTATQRARKSLLQKLEFERKIARKLNRLNVKLVKDFRKQYAENGKIIDAAGYRDEYESLLHKHYEAVGSKFSSHVEDELDDDLKQDEQEQDIIWEALSLYFLTRSGEQSLIITETNQKDILRSVEKGTIASSESEEGFERVTAAAFAATVLYRSLNARKTTIAITETQNAAEVAKSTEAEVMAGMTPSINAVIPTVQKKITKEWVTVGDEKVRDTHVAADGQERDLDEAYEVGGHLMMYPGDTRFNAPMSEIINCRCASEINIQEIIDYRSEEELP